MGVHVQQVIAAVMIVAVLPVFRRMLGSMSVTMSGSGATIMNLGLTVGWIVMALVGLLVLAVLAAGCSTDKIHEWTRAEPVPLTDFLPQNERLVRRADTFLVHYRSSSRSAACVQNCLPRACSRC